MRVVLIQLARFDHQALTALVARRQRLIVPVLKWLTHLGDAVAVIGLGLGLALGVVPGLEDAGRQSLCALVLSHALVQLLKRSIARPRPDLPAGAVALIAAPDRFSFPSGHSAASLSVALPVALALPSSGAIGVLGIAGLVGVSRCYLGVHYPGDVLAGWALAILATLTAPGLLTAAGLA